VKEDILRILCETNKSTSSEIIKAEIKAAPTLISKALEELQKEELNHTKRKVYFIDPARKRKSKTHSGKPFSS
jgi:hypothetical protein